jgi:hypothetical protein
MTDNNNPVAPLPNVVTSFRDDLITPIQWQVVETHGDLGVGVDFASGVIAVPLRGDSYAQRVQLQQLVRARVSPIDKGFYDYVVENYRGQGMTSNVLRAAEIARVNAITEQFAKVRGIDNEPDGSEKIRGKRLATANSTQAWDAAVEYTILNAGTKGFDSFASGIRSVNPDWSKKLRNINKRVAGMLNRPASVLGNTQPIDYGEGNMGPDGFRHTLNIACEVLSYLSDGYQAPDDIKNIKRGEDDERAQNYGKLDDETLQRGEYNPQSSDLDTDDFPDHYEFPHDENGFGPLRINDSLPLSVEVDGYMRRKKRSAQIGRSVGNPSRLLTDPDRRVFRRKVKVRGGVVIVDISGSMSLTEQDLNDIIEVCPASIILAYSDVGDNVPNAWILANRGWRVKEIGDIGGGGNGVDGTALTWGIRHRKFGEDMVWISDGQVHSNTGGQNVTIVGMCAKLLKKHRIIMIPSVEQAVAMFKRGKLINKPAGPIRDYLLGKYR